MLLQDWLSQEDFSYAQFAGCVSRTAEAVRRYANGERIPDRETMVAIVHATDGHVTPNDFYGVGAIGAKESELVEEAVHAPTSAAAAGGAPWN